MERKDRLSNLWADEVGSTMKVYSDSIIEAICAEPRFTGNVKWPKRKKLTAKQTLDLEMSILKKRIEDAIKVLHGEAEICYHDEEY